MNALTLVQLAASILQGVLASIPGGDKYKLIATSIQAAIAELQQVHGTDVTRAQLEDLRVSALW